MKYIGKYLSGKILLTRECTLYMDKELIDFHTRGVTNYRIGNGKIIRSSTIHNITKSYSSL